MSHKFDSFTGFFRGQSKRLDKNCTNERNGMLEQYGYVSKIKYGG